MLQIVTHFVCAISDFFILQVLAEKLIVDR